MPQYCLVKHRIENVTIDGADPDRNPDRMPVTGMVTFTPLLGKGDAVVITENGQKTTLTLAPIEARITNGELWHRGEPGVKLFAGGPDTNPERIRYRAQFSNLIGGGRKVELKDILFEAVPGGELSLAVAQPVPGVPYPGYGATIEAGIAEISDVAVSYLELIEGARDEAMGQVGGAVAAEIGNTTQYVNFPTDDRFANHIVKLNSDGKLHISTAGITALTDTANKQYVDTAVATKADRTHQHNAVDITGGTTQYVSYVDDRFANQLLRLNASGKFHITTSSITGLNDPVNKQYVDSKVGNSAGGRLLWWN